ncbi:MAG: AMP-binding protein [Pirellulales bacterium]
MPMSSVETQLHHAVLPMRAENPQPWVDGLTIGEVLRRTSERYPERLAASFAEFTPTVAGESKTTVPHPRPLSQGERGGLYPAVRWSYGEFLLEVERAARGLLALGIQPGEHVAIWAPNVPEWLALQFATASIGAVLVTINPAYRPAELRYVLEQSDSVALFLSRTFRSADYHEILAEVEPTLTARTPGVAGQVFPKLRWVVGIEGEPPAGGISWREMLERGRAVPQRQLLKVGAALRPEQAINIQYTSGTTGFPKAATLSHRNLLLNAYYIGACQRLTHEDRICIPVPFYHCFGCVLGTLAAPVFGAGMVMPAPWFQPRPTLEAIERDRCTALYGVPTMFIAMLQDETCGERDFSSVRTGIMAGSPCPIEIMRQVIDRLNAKEMTIAYGQTEAAPVITQTRADDPLDLRVETVGQPLPGVEVKLIDPCTGEELGDNQQGELCARGHGTMIGYYRQPEATAAAIDPEGWLHTGDLALRRADGYYRITGRLKDMVIRGGENIYPREIEEFLFTHPAIEQASVVGVPDPKYGEELCAWIKVKGCAAATEDEIRQFCRHGLAHFKTPRYVRFVDTFPQTVTGKIQKYKIRQTMIEELGLVTPETA